MPIVISLHSSNGRIYISGVDQSLPLAMRNSLLKMVWRGKLASDEFLDLTNLFSGIYFLSALLHDCFDPINIMINKQ